MTCDRVLIINRGKLVAEDTPENLTTQIRGGDRVRVLVQGEESALRQALSGVEGIRDLTVTPLREPGRLTAVIEATPGHDLRGEISARIVGQGLGLYELRSERMSLEEIFLQLTTEEHHEEAARREA
jgi:ABC-2 type transport system ATP-binding protein